MKTPSSLLALVLCSAAASCFGTETGNPGTSNPPGGLVYSSPNEFGPPEPGAPPCIDVPPEERAFLPRTSARRALLSTSRGRVLAQGDRQGLAFVDVGDPAAPRVLSHMAIPAVYDLLVGNGGRLWVLEAEPLELGAAVVPSLEALDFRLRLLELDVSDPVHPVRVAQVELDGVPWGLRSRGDAVWVTTAQRRAAELACDAPRDGMNCAEPTYEALVVRGFRPSNGALEPIGQALLPFAMRAWWGSDAIVSAAGGSLHVLAWDTSGTLLAPLDIDVPNATPVVEGDLGAELALGPGEVIGRQLFVVRAAGTAATLDVYDLDGAGPPHSYALGERARPSARSSFHAQRLWLQPLDSAEPAQVWDISGPEPAPLLLPIAHDVVLPVAGATRAQGQAGEVLALAWSIDSVGNAQDGALLSVSGASVSGVAALGADSWAPDQGGFGNGNAAPGGIAGAGPFAKWFLLQPGAGLPLEIQPDVAPSGAPDIRASVAAFAAEGLQGTLQVASVPVGNGGSTAEVQLGFASAEATFPLSPDTGELFATRTHLVTFDATDLRRCQQTGDDCSARSPGVSIFAATGTPRLVAELPLPELPLPAPTSTSQVEISWQIYDPVTNGIDSALSLGDERLVFVAQAQLSCQTPEDCEALGVEALPFGEANVITGDIACPPNDPDCVPGPAPAPGVYGSSQRQYYYVLDLEAPGGPAWQAWGTSSLESSTARRDGGGFSSFGAPLATDGVLAATRREREDGRGQLLPEGTSRFMLDRLAPDGSGAPRALPPVNIPGYPLARLAVSGSSERWLAVEPSPDASGHARLLQLDIQGSGAQIADELALDTGNFASLRVIESGGARLGVAVLTPTHACGSTVVSAVRLGASASRAPLELGGQIALPRDRWSFAASDGAYVLLQHYPAYVLLHVDSDGGLALAASHTFANLSSTQLIGSTLVSADRVRPLRIELLP